MFIAPSPIISLAVKSLNKVDKYNNWSRVIGGNIFLNACSIGFITASKASRILAKPLITASLPPLAFQKESVSFLALADAPTMAEKPLDIAVKNLVD